MRYKDFYKIAKRLNELHGNVYTEQEVAENAHDYFTEYNYSIKRNKVSVVMFALCYDVILDSETEDLRVTVTEMKEILQDFLKYKC